MTVFGVVFFVLTTPPPSTMIIITLRPTGVSLARVSVCMPWSPSQIAGCSACFDVLPNSKLQGASVSSEETESGRTSPVLTDPVIFSPRRQQNRRSECKGAQGRSRVPAVAECQSRSLRSNEEIIGRVFVLCDPHMPVLCYII